MKSSRDRLKDRYGASFTDEALEALTAATSGAARVLGLHEAIGTIAVGYRGDVITVQGRPDEDITDLDYVRDVIIDGVVQHIEPPGWTENLALAASIAWQMLRL